MDNPTPDAPDSGNAADAPDAPEKNAVPNDAGDNTPQDDAPVDVKPPKKESGAATPPAKAESKEKPAEKPQPDSADGDEVLYHGSVSLWLGWRSFATSIAAASVGLALLITGLIYAGWLYTLGIYIGLPLLIAAALMYGYVFLSLRCLRYKITNRLIERERGIWKKYVDHVDLARVKDVQLVQSLPERMLRIGTIEIISSDRSDPEMRIEAIPKPRPIYEKLRDAVLRITQKRGIIAMDR
jgi:hypothetical protein